MAWGGDGQENGAIGWSCDWVTCDSFAGLVRPSDSESDSDLIPLTTLG